MGFFGGSRNKPHNPFPEKDKNTIKCAPPSRNRKKLSEYTEEEMRANFIVGEVQPRKAPHRSDSSEEITYTDNKHREFKKAGRAKDNHTVQAPSRNRRKSRPTEMSEQELRFVSASKDDLRKSQEKLREKERAKGSRHCTENDHRHHSRSSSRR